jgi:hypothetical protein
MPMTNQADCLRCNGSGQWVNPRNAMDVRPCFGCRPGGFRGRPRRYGFPATNTNPVAVAGLPRGVAAVDLFRTSHPAECAWLESNMATNDFAQSLLLGIRRYGNLTPRQLAAVQRNLPATPVVVNAAAAVDAGGCANLEPVTVDDMAAAGFEGDSAAIAAETPMQQAVRVSAEFNRPLPPAPPPLTFDVSRVLAAMDAAKASGLIKVRLTIGNFELRLSGERFTRGPGLIMVYYSAMASRVAREHRRAYRFGSPDYIGYIKRDGTFMPRAGQLVGNMLPGIIDGLQNIFADPQAASRAHGLDYGFCGCCRRLLTDPVSVMQGIGPVCVERFGWRF